MKKNVYLLRLLGLPVFSSCNELANMLHIEPAKLILFNKYSHAGKYYLEHTIRKSDGSARTIRQPGRRLKAVQAWILRHILDKLKPSPYATAFRSGINLTYNVVPHLSNRYFLCLDIEDYFPSIKTWRVAIIFELVGYSKNAASILANLCTCKNSLPQGGVTSPALSNLVGGKIDRRMAGYTSRRNISYTRYADDMTFATNNPRVLSRALPMLRKIVETSGFRLNDAKQRMFGPRRRCLITGLTKNSSKPRFGIGRKRKRDMRAIMYNLIIKGHSDHRYPNISSIEGWLSYLNSVDTDSFEQMSRYYRDLKQRAS